MLNFETHDAILEDQPKSEMSMESKFPRIEAAVEHMTADIKDIKLSMQEFRRDLQGMNQEMYRGFEAANDATARVELSLCETRMEQKSLRVEQEALKTEQQAMRADLKTMRTDLDAVRTDQKLLREEVKTACAELRGDIKALGEGMGKLGEGMGKQILASQNKMILWTVGAIIAATGVVLTAVKLFH